MNQDITQRVVGAIVLTALAAIFIPMLFEDPVDNSGQVVSELTIPEESAITMDDQISKLPRNAEDIAPLPDETTETPASESIANMDSTTPPMEESEQAMVGDPTDPELPGEGAGQSDNIVDTPITADTSGTVQEEAIEPAVNPVIDAGELHDIAKPAKKTTPIKPIIKADAGKKLAPQASEPIIAKPTVKPVKTPGSLARYYLQAGSFSKKENALALSDAIRKQGMPVIFETVQTGRGTMYRLRVGPELDKKRAASMKSKLDQQNISSILVTE